MGDAASAGAAAAAAAAAVGALNAGGWEARRSARHGGGQRVVRHNDGEREDDVAGGVHREPRRAVQPVAVVAPARLPHDPRLGAVEPGGRRRRGGERVRGRRRRGGDRVRGRGRRTAAVALQLRVGHVRSRRRCHRCVGNCGAPACLICLRRRREGNGGARTDPEGGGGVDGVLVGSHKGKREAVCLHLRHLLVDIVGGKEAALVVRAVRVNQDQPPDVGVGALGGRHGCEELLARAGSRAQPAHQGVAQQRQAARVKHLLLVGVQQGKVERGQVNLVVVSLGDVVECRQGKEGFNLLFASDAPLRVEEIVHSLAGARPEDAHGTGAVHDRFNNLVRQGVRPRAPRAVNLGPLNAVQAGKRDLAHVLVSLVW